MKKLFISISLLLAVVYAYAAFIPTAGAKYYLFQNNILLNVGVGSGATQPTVQTPTNNSSSQLFEFIPVSGKADTYYIKNGDGKYLNELVKAADNWSVVYETTTNGLYSEWVIVGDAANNIQFKQNNTQLYLGTNNYPAVGEVIYCNKALGARGGLFTLKLPQLVPTAGIKYNLCQNNYYYNVGVVSGTTQPVVQTPSSSLSQSFEFIAVSGKLDTYYLKNGDGNYLNELAATGDNWSVVYQTTTNGLYSEWVIVGAVESNIRLMHNRTLLYLGTNNSPPNGGTLMSSKAVDALGGLFTLKPFVTPFVPIADVKYNIVQNKSNLNVGAVTTQPAVQTPSSSTSQAFVFIPVSGKADTYYIKNGDGNYLNKLVAASDNYTVVLGAATNGLYSEWYIVGGAANTIRLMQNTTLLYLGTNNVVTNGTYLYSSKMYNDVNGLFTFAVCPPSLTAATSPTVDVAFDITYTDDASWRGAITSITVGGTTLSASAYSVTAGKITFTPSLSTLLQSSGSKSIVVIATGYPNTTVSQTLNAGVPTSNSTATIGSALSAGTSQTVTCTAKDQYNNLVSGYTFKYDATVTNGDAATAESYTLDGTASTATASDVNVTTTTNASGVAIFTAALPSTIDGGDGVSVQVQLSNGSTNVGSAFSLTSQTYSLNSTKNASDLALNSSSDVTVSSGELTINQATAVKSIVVAPGAKLTVTGLNSLSATDGVTLQSSLSGTATLVDNYNTPTVTATVQQYLPQGRNWYLSIPTTSGNISSLIGGGFATSVSYYSEELGWQNNYTGALTPGVGYIAVSAAGSGTSNTSFNGTLNSGNIAVTLTRKSTGTYAGYNLIANPYPSYINIMPAINANSNLVGTVWYRTRKTVSPYDYKFETVNTTSGVGTNNAGTGTVTGYIPPMQSFWIRTNADNQTLTFTNAMRDHARNVTVLGQPVPTTVLKAHKQVSQSLARIKVAGVAGSDEAVLYFDTDAANTFDKYDSPKMFESTRSVVPEIYTQVGSDKLVINGLNAVQYDTEIPLGFVAKTAGDYNITASEMTNFETGTRIVLIDKDAPNPENELSAGVVYPFSSPATTASTSRFSLIFRAPGVATGIDNTAKLNARVFVNTSNQITIVAPEKSNYSIYNTLGQKLIEGIAKKNQTNTSLQKGMYVVKVSDCGKELTTKIIIN
jgi:hypothetical protein